MIKMKIEELPKYLAQALSSEEVDSDTCEVINLLSENIWNLLHKDLRLKKIRHTAFPLAFVKAWTRAVVSLDEFRNQHDELWVVLKELGETVSSTS